MLKGTVIAAERTAENLVALSIQMESGPTIIKNVSMDQAKRFGIGSDLQYVGPRKPRKLKNGDTFEGFRGVVVAAQRGDNGAVDISIQLGADCNNMTIVEHMTLDEAHKFGIGCELEFAGPKVVVQKRAPKLQVSEEVPVAV